MGRVIYAMNVSLDGYAADPDGGLGWADVDEEVHGWFNDLARDAGVFVYGRRMYELMSAYWPTADEQPDATPATRDFAAIWRPKPKVVFSSTLDRVHWNSRITRDQPRAELSRLRDETDGDVGIGGPTLAAAFIREGLVDEYRLVLHPVILGGGLPFFPALERPIGLRQIAEQRFDGGAIYLGYAAR